MKNIMILNEREAYNASRSLHGYGRHGRKDPDCRTYRAATAKTLAIGMMLAYHHVG